MITQKMVDQAYDFVRNITDESLYELIIRTENIGWPIITSVAQGFVDIEGVTLEGEHYVECTYRSLIEYGMEA